MIEGARLKLRPLEPDDLDLVHNWFSDTELIRYMQAYQDPPVTRGDIEKRIGRTLKEDPDSVEMVVGTGDCDRVGLVFLHDIDYKNRKAELGVVIGEHSRQAKGLGTEAVEMILKVAFERLSLHRVYASIDPANGPMLRVMEKLGFTRDGALREDWWADGQPWDAIIYSMLSHEYSDLQSE